MDLAKDLTEATLGLPELKREEVIARAQRILDLRGQPPYDAKVLEMKGQYISNDEAAILSEFVTYWLPFLVEKEK